MVKTLFQKIFGSKNESDKLIGTIVPNGDIGDEAEQLSKFVRFVVSNLVDFPEKVQIKTGDNKNFVLMQVTCEKTDIGKIVGKQGKTIAAIRSLITGAASRLGKRAKVEVLD